MSVVLRLLFLLLLSALAFDTAAQSEDECVTAGKIAVDSAHGAVLKRNCEVWMWGFNDAGQLASEPQALFEPEQFHKPKNVPPLLDIIVARDHTLGIAQDRRAYVWGSREYLSCGGDHHPYSVRPEIIPGLSNVKAIAAARQLNVFLTTDGEVLEQGCNNDTEDTIARVPQRVAGLPKIRAIAVGGHHRMALSDRGEVWAWGPNYCGELGTGDKVPRVSPSKVPGIPEILSIAAGSSHSLALDIDGRVWVWGSNQSWESGLGVERDCNLSPKQIPALPEIRSIVTAWSLSAALTADGRIFLWGSTGKSDWAFSTPTEVEDVIDTEAIYVGGNALQTEGLFIVRDQGRIFRWEPNQLPYPPRPVPRWGGKLLPFPEPESGPFDIGATNVGFERALASATRLLAEPTSLASATADQPVRGTDATRPHISERSPSEDSAYQRPLPGYTLK